MNESMNELMNECKRIKRKEIAKKNQKNKNNSARGSGSENISNSRSGGGVAERMSRATDIHRPDSVNGAAGCAHETGRVRKGKEGGGRGNATTTTTRNKTIASRRSIKASRTKHGRMTTAYSAQIRTAPFSACPLLPSTRPLFSLPPPRSLVLRYVLSRYVMSR